MKKHRFFYALLGLVAVGCSNESVNDVESALENALVPVTVRVDGFAVSQEEFSDSGTTRAATAIGDYSSLKAIALAFYKSDGTELVELLQLKDDNTTYTTYGEFTTTLPLGSYTMVVIGRAHYEGDVLELTSPTSASYTSDRVRETFATTQTVNITGNAVNLSATLDRVVSKVVVHSTDNRTTNVSNIRVTFSAGGKSFSPTTGLATVNTGFSNTTQGNTIEEPVIINNYVFLATDQQTMNITVETLDSEGNTLFSETVNEVPLQRNKQTTLTGKMFSADVAAGSFKLNTEWIDGNSVSF